MKLTVERPLHEPGRKNIYYWKCDRPAAFHGTQTERESSLVEPELLRCLQHLYPGRSIHLRDGGGQGNHLTWIADIGLEQCFIRVENGPERDNHLEVETHVLRCVERCGVPTPTISHVDATRSMVPFAYQVMNLIPARDLNQEFKQGRLDPEAVAFRIGAAVARWQSVPVRRFGHFDPAEFKLRGELVGYHSTYENYFHLNWEKHLRFLEDRRFLSSSEAKQIRDVEAKSAWLLSLTQGCLVHKDLAFWNILGDQETIAAYIDWDDAVAADEMDDLSLLGCFHDGPVISKALDGYASVRKLPEDYSGRFWLHLLRNMIVKSVIRVGAGYFDRTDGFFLIGSGMTGADFVKQTRSRLFRIVEGLRTQASPSDL